MWIILCQDIWDLNIYVWSVGLPEGVVEVLTVKQSYIVTALITPDALMGAQVSVTLQEGISEFGTSLLGLGVTW